MSPDAEMLPSWVNAASVVLPQKHLEDSARHVDLSTLRQEKRPRRAWWTCDDCPQPNRWHEWTMDTVQGRLWKVILQKEEAAFDWVMRGRKRYPAFKTVYRCKRCNRMRDRHGRAQRSLRDVLKKQFEHVGTSARFVTLTVPNEFLGLNAQGILEASELTRLVRELKAKMYAFSRTAAYKDKVIGAVEFYEQTYKIEDGGVDVNTHIHAVWLGEFWAQDQLQEAWDGIVHITKPKSQRSVMKYISKYVVKDPIPGTRAKETRGVLRKG